jgi:hypothetical protein
MPIPAAPSVLAEAALPATIARSTRGAWPAAAERDGPGTDRLGERPFDTCSTDAGQPETGRAETPGRDGGWFNAN